MNMDKMIDSAMTKLFQLAEYVSNKWSPAAEEPAVPQNTAPKKTAPQNAALTIRFSHEDRMVEGDLFK